MTDAQRNLPLGIALIVTAFFFSAMTGFIGKFTHAAPVTMTVFVQYAVSLVAFAPLALRHGRAGLATKHARLHVVRSLSASSAQLLFFYSLGTLPLLDASLLSNTSPLFIPLIVLVWLHKRVRAVVWLSLGIGLVGVVLVIRPGPELFRDPASAIALASGFLSAVGLTTTNKLTETEPPYRILFYNFGISTACLLPLALATWRGLSPRLWLLLLAIGVCFALTQYCIIIAYKYASATALSPFNYSVVIFAGLLGWIFLHDTPGIAAIAGTALICVGGIASTRGGHREGLSHPADSGFWTLYRRRRAVR